MKWLGDESLDHLQRLLDLPDLGGTRYELLEPLGRGGMATVHRAFDRELHRPVALKVLNTAVADEQTQARLRQEAQILARIEHPGIVPVHDLGLLPDGRWFYAMREVRGRRLDQVVGEGATQSERLRIFGRICEAVAFAHAHGVIHRDLKPENVMVGSFGEVFVLDWGVAKVLQSGGGPAPDQEKPSGGGSISPSAEVVTPEEALRTSEPAASCEMKGVVAATRHGTIIGTRGYMSPEQERGEVDAVDQRSDVFSLGGILQFAMTGAVPASPAGEWSGRPPVHRTLRAICARACASEPGQRYATVLLLMEDVNSYLQKLPVAADPENWWRKLRRIAAKHRTALLLVLAYVVVRLAILLTRGI